MPTSWPSYDRCSANASRCSRSATLTATTTSPRPALPSRKTPSSKHAGYGYDCFADDSGLEVDALGGRPGIHSARYAGEHGDSNANNALLLRELEGYTDRTARFRCTIALLVGDDEPRFFNGTVEGSIIEHPDGSQGFGYDPLFRPDGWDCTFAQAAPERKNAVSHRGKAVSELVKYLEKLY